MHIRCSGCSSAKIVRIWKKKFTFSPVGFLEEFISLTLAIGSICDGNPRLSFSNHLHHTIFIYIYKNNPCGCGNWIESMQRASALTQSQHSYRAEDYCHELKGLFLVTLLNS